MNTLVLVIVGGLLLLASWVLVWSQKYYLAPIALIFSGATYILSFFMALILSLFSFGKIDPFEETKKILKEFQKQTLIVVVVILATIVYGF